MELKPITPKLLFFFLVSFLQASRNRRRSNHRLLAVVQSTVCSPRFAPFRPPSARRRSHPSLSFCSSFKPPSTTTCSPPFVYSPSLVCSSSFSYLPFKPPTTTTFSPPFSSPLLFTQTQNNTTTTQPPPSPSPPSLSPPPLPSHRNHHTATTTTLPLLPPRLHHHNTTAFLFPLLSSFLQFVLQNFDFRFIWFNFCFIWFNFKFIEVDFSFIWFNFRFIGVDFRFTRFGLWLLKFEFWQNK